MNSTSEPWEWVDGVGHCRRHATTFDRGESCGPCDDDPGERFDVVAQAIDDTDAIAAEDRVMDVALQAKLSAEEFLTGTEREKATAVKFYDTFLKATRLWYEMRNGRLAVKHDWELVKHDKAVAGLRGSH